jgi:uncharacterized protein (DUF58 family)
MSLLASKPRSRNKAIRRKPSLDFSLTAFIYTCMMLFMGLAAVNSQANLLFGVFGLMIGVLFIAWVVSRMVLRKLSVRRVLSEHLTVGEPAALQYEFNNRKRFWPSLSVTIGELDGAEGFTKQPQAYLLHAAAGTMATVPTQVVPARRGLHQLDRFQLSTSFPFGFVRRAVDRRQKDTVLVHPPIGEVDRRLLALCLAAERSGARMRPRRGGADEFYGVKEFRHGENPRWIHWRRSARTGTLVAREMAQVAPPRLLVFLDTFIARRTIEEHAAVERAIAMAASLVSRTLDQGLAVGLCVWSNGRSIVPPSRGKRHARDLLALLARLPLNTTADHRALLENTHRLLRSGTTPVLLTPRDVERSLSEQARGNWIVIPTESEQGRRWFRFPSGVDFGRCMPPEQAPAG